jgi:hypothetical protein
MQCVLRACGKDFDVDRFLASSHWCTDSVYHDGEKRRVRVGGRDVYSSSGFNLCVPGSDTAGDTFPDQTKAVLAFLLRDRPELDRLCAFRGRDECILDFAVDFVEEASMLSLHLPADLVRAAGQLGIAIEIALFRTNEAGEWLVPGAP